MCLPNWLLSTPYSGKGRVGVKFIGPIRSSKQRGVKAVNENPETLYYSLKTCEVGS